MNLLDDDRDQVLQENTAQRALRVTGGITFPSHFQMGLGTPSKCPRIGESRFWRRKARRSKIPLEGARLPEGALKMTGR